jgi:hypothetical protein
MNLAFPYHDPQGIYSDALWRHLDHLRSVFDVISLGATPPTVVENAAMLADLRAAGCLIAENGPGTSIGDHSRSALRLAVKGGRPSEPTAFLFLDRFLYAMETDHKEPFLADITRYREQACMVFERTPAAWVTHPASYKEVEGMTTRLGELLFGSTVDWSPCALIFGAGAARAILAESDNPTYAVWAEWILLAAQHGATISSTEVDWLAWEDPYWARVVQQAWGDAEEYRRAQETDPHQIVKRIHMHAPIALLFAEPRFRNVTIRRQRL